MKNLSIAFGLALVAGCTSREPLRPPDDGGGNPPPPNPSTLVFERPKDDGTLTPRMAGSSGPPLRVRVVNSSSHNAPVAGLFVKWEAVSVGTRVSEELVPTDAYGYSSTTFTVGTTVGNSLATATLNEHVENFYLMVVPSVPSTMTGGRDDTTAVNRVDEWCIAEIRDVYGNEIPHVLVDWTVVGDATPTSGTEETDSAGRSWFFFDVGPLTGDLIVTGVIQGDPLTPPVTCHLTVL